MLKGRIILAVVMLTVVSGTIVLWQTGIPYGGKLVVTGFGAFLYLNTCIVVAINLFALDRQGRIPKGSLVWRYFDHMYSAQEKNEEGVWVKKSNPRDHINLCPMYWTVAVGLAMLLIVGTITLGALPAVGFGIFVAVASGHTIKLLFIAGCSVASIVLGTGLLWLLIQMYGKLGAVGIKRFWVLTGFLVVASIAVAVYVGAPHAAEFGPANENARVEGAFEIGKTTGIVIGGIIAAIVASVVVILAYALAARFKSFSWIKNSLIGKMIAALYHKFCAVVPVETAEPSSETVA